MHRFSLPRLDLRDWHQNGPKKDAFVDQLGDALSEVGFFALVGHGVGGRLLDEAYQAAREFFAQTDAQKRLVYDTRAKAQRGFTPFQTERALGANAADLKEFFQVGRVDTGDAHPVHQPYGPNRWPDLEHFQARVSALYRALDEVARDVLAACASYLGEGPTFFDELTRGGDTILRLIHYPPTRDSGERASAHEDINLITLLPGATADGLELLQRDGTWRAVAAGHDALIVDTGDMMQHLSNGLLRSVTHRVALPEGGSDEARFSMPFFVHPRHDAELTPRAKCVEKTGGRARFGPTTARALLDERLRAIGVG